MTFEERCELYKQMRLRGVKAKELAEICKCSSSWISQWFNKPEVKISQDMQDKIIEYVNSK
ncbi:helix-turn-helix domain-containing protein [Lysinibacillus sphaericus]|uniref:helix-turn-helix domain-containing protein n=1 Tax=Lysinibacillus sphaericus TaxID=1421 RepID=UPI000CDF1E68|nr:helix-turn-helix transcriptional regulator [Lysinibacillus sphaericus]